MLFAVISETKDFCLPGHHSGSVHLQAISLKTSTEMKNKTAEAIETTCKNVFNLPQIFAGITSPFLLARSLTAVTTNSLEIIIATGIMSTRFSLNKYK